MSLPNSCTTTPISLPSLPPPFCPPDSPSPVLAHLRHHWLQRNAPVFLQPTIDIVHGNGLLCAFYHFSHDNTTCVLSLVFEGEASWEVQRPTAVNRFGSFVYRTHNYRTYCRTADVDHIAYHRCTLQQPQQPQQQFGDENKRAEESRTTEGTAAGRGPHPQAAAVDVAKPEWQVLHTTDFSGLQSWSKGSRARFLYFYSLMHHYDLEMRRDGWRQWNDHWTLDQQQQQLEQWRHIDLQHHTANTSVHDRLQSTPSNPYTQPTAHYRPIVYLNTGNHLMSPFNTNPSFPTAAYTVHHTYPLFPGDRSVAERFGQLAVRRKWTLYSFVPSWLYVPGGGKMEVERRVWRRMHHSVLLEGRVEARRRVEVEGAAGEDERKEKMSVADASGRVVAVVESMDRNAAIEQSPDTPTATRQ